MQSLTPPRVTDKTFPGVMQERCVLLVPMGSVADYNTTPVWMGFKTIKGF